MPGLFQITYPFNANSYTNPILFSMQAQREILRRHTRHEAIQIKQIILNANKVAKKFKQKA